MKLSLRLSLLALLLLLGVLLGRWLSRTDSSGQEQEVVVGGALPVRIEADTSWQPSPTTQVSYPRGAFGGQLVVTFEDEAAYRAYLAELERAGVSVTGRIDRLLTLRLNESTLRKYFPKNGDIKVGFNYEVQPPLPPELVNPEALARLRAFGLSATQITGEQASTGKGVRIAILDSGLMEHAQFAESDIEVLDYTESGMDAEGAGHGTSVASIIGGKEGIAPDATLLVMRVLGEEGIGSSFTVASAIVDAVDADADIINLSLGLYVDTPILRNAVAYAEQQGVLLVAAAGNDGYGALSYPAAYESVIAVTAVDANSTQAIFPNQSKEIDFAAPGVGILTAKDDSGTTLFTGTSAAAPFVSGILATLLASELNQSPQQSVELLSNYLNEAGAPGVDPLYGAGIVDWQRLRERDQEGVIDIALAGITLGEGAMPGTTMPVEVTVQNRGTEWLYNAQLEVTLGGSEPQQFKLEALAPGKTATRKVTALSPANQDEPELEIVATVLPEEELRDLRLENNFKAVQFVPNQ
ncbi:MAG: S8 family serine peptidase [Coraliomargarita sp.]